MSDNTTTQTVREILIPFLGQRFGPCKLLTLKKKERKTKKKGGGGGIPLGSWIPDSQTSGLLITPSRGRRHNSNAHFCNLSTLLLLFKFCSSGLVNAFVSRLQLSNIPCKSLFISRHRSVSVLNIRTVFNCALSFNKSTLVSLMRVFV